jgi:alkyl hydroperoxide reductase subunit AhpC
VLAELQRVGLKDSILNRKEATLTIPRGKESLMTFIECDFSYVCSAEMKDESLREAWGGEP